MADRGLDGVNLDIEPIPERLADEYVELVRTVRTALDEVDPELGLTLEVHPSLVGYDLAGLTGEGAADRAIIMGYEYRGDGAATTGSQAPLADDSGSDLRTTIDGALAQVGGDKLIVALPWYGRAWSADSPEPGAATVSGEEIDGPATVDYDAAVLQAIESGREYATGQESAWTSYVSQDCTDCPATWRQLWYDDHDSFGAKVDHALGAGLAGVGIWALGFDGDRPELWSALRQRIMRTVDEQAPNGSASLEPSAGTGRALRPHGRRGLGPDPDVRLRRATGQRARLRAREPRARPRRRRHARGRAHLPGQPRRERTARRPRDRRHRRARTA